MSKSNQKKYSIILVFCFVLSFFMFTTPKTIITSITGNWSTYSVSTPPLLNTSSTNSSSNPYLVDSASEFIWCMSNITGKNLYIKLTSNINLEEHYYNLSPTCSSGKIVSIDGNGFCISGLTFNSNYSLISSASGKLSIKNLIINCVYSCTSSDSAVLIKKIESAGVVNLSNISIYGSVNNSGTGSYASVFVAQNLGSLTITKCINTASINCNATYTGAFVGYTSGSKTDITYCANYGNITSSGNYIGGLIGNIVTGSKSIKLEYNFNKGNITTTSTSTSGGVGGLVGLTSVAMSISYCYNNGNVEGKGISIGGLVGNSSSYKQTISYCYNSGTLSTTKSLVTTEKLANQGIIGETNGSPYLVNDRYEDPYAGNYASAIPGFTRTYSNNNITKPIATPYGGDDDSDSYQEMYLSFNITSLTKATSITSIALVGGTNISATKSIGLSSGATAGTLLSAVIDLRKVQGSTTTIETAYGAQGSVGNFSYSSNGTLTVNTFAESTQVYRSISDQGWNYGRYRNFSDNYGFMYLPYPLELNGYRSYNLTGASGAYFWKLPMCNGNGYFDNGDVIFYLTGVVIKKNSNSLTLYPMIMADHQLIQSGYYKGNANTAFAYTETPITINLPSLSKASYETSSIDNIKSADLGTEYQCISNVNGGLPFLKSMYWAY